MYISLPTDTSMVEEDEVHPAPEAVYVIVTVPASTPVTTPVEASTVATVRSPEDQVPPAEPLVERVVDEPMVIEVVPLSVPASGTSKELNVTD